MEYTWEPAASTWGVITEIPLPTAVHNLLASLQPPQPQENYRSQRGSRGARPLPEQDQLHRLDELDPTISGRLPAVGVVHLHAADGRALQPLWFGATAPAVRATPGDVAVGRSPRQVAERSPLLGLLLVPAGIEVDKLIWAEILSQGITQITWSLGPSSPMPPPETARRRLSGDWTLVDVRGQLVMVSYASTAGTTLSWQGRRAGMACAVRM